MEKMSERRMIPTLSLLGVFASLWLSACIGERVAGGTGVGNPTKGSVTVSMQAASGTEALAKRGATQPRNPDGSFSVTDAGGTVFTIRSGYANIGKVKLKLPDGLGCSSADETACQADEVEITGPFVADLMSGAWQPDPGVFRIPVGDYKSIQVRLEAPENDSQPSYPGLAGHSMIIKGEFAYAGKSGRTFSLALDFNEDARFESTAGVGVSAQGLNKLIVLLNVDQWLGQADITKCLDDGSILLDTLGNLAMDQDNACLGLESSIKEAVKASGSIHDKHE